jgi:ABC-type transport system involved in multi-copper enzyme maturation permease subunit
MIWLSWRQFRAQAAVIGLLLAAIAVTLVLARLNLSRPIAGGPSGEHVVQLLGTALVVVPALLGAFCGAPLVARELEAGTQQLAWTQSVTRTRWLAVRMCLVGLATVAGTEIFALLLSWAARPGDALNKNLFGMGLFGERGIVPAGYAAFAFALGVAAGVIIRRTIPAIVLTLGVFTGFRLLFSILIRPRLITPVRAVSLLNVHAAGIEMDNRPGSPGAHTVTVFPYSVRPGAWVYSTQLSDAAGHPVSDHITPAPAACQHDKFRLCTEALSRLHLHQVVTYQPASRFWAFQGLETAIFAALALALAGLCFWWVRRRLS